jgi:multidrug resistance protein
VPSIVGELGGFNQFPWLFSAYLLGQAVTTPIYAKLSDIFGRKPILLLGIALFLAGSILCALAWNMPALIIFRAVQGLGAGAVQPTAMTIVGDIYTLAERARVQGYLASVWAISSVIGPLLGGVFSQLGIWRGVFLINIPLCLLAAWMFSRHFHEKVTHRRRNVDALGAALLACAMTALILAVLGGGQTWAWSSAPSISAFGAGAAALGGTGTSGACMKNVWYAMRSPAISRAAMIARFSISLASPSQLTPLSRPCQRIGGGS